MTDLVSTLAEALATHATVVDRLGIEVPEQTRGDDQELIGKLIRQRQKLARALAGDDVDAVEKHARGLTKGLKLVLQRYGATSC